MEDVIAVSAGGSQTLAITSDGSLWFWGGDWMGHPGEGPVARVMNAPIGWFLPDPFSMLAPTLVISAGAIVFLIIWLVRERKNPPRSTH